MRFSDDPHIGWIGVDLDRTLAERTQGDGQGHEIGQPIPAMLARVKQWLAEGRNVKIFTARVHPLSGNDDGVGERVQRNRILAWCKEHIGQELPITCMKDYYCVAIWDDLAVAVEENTGRVLSRAIPAYPGPLANI